MTASTAPMRPTYGEVTACRNCGQDIQFLGREFGWFDFKGNRKCDLYVDPVTFETRAATTKHAPPRNRHA